MGMRAGTGVELAGAERPGALAEREAPGDRPPPRAAGVRAADARRSGSRGLMELTDSPDPADTPRSCSSPTPSPITTSPRSARRRSSCSGGPAARVTLGPPGLRCCGRPLISNGMLDQAVANARHNVERLYDWARQGGPIVACEPSCILTIKDDYPALLRGELRAQAEAVARACLTFEEFLESILVREAGPTLSTGSRARGGSSSRGTAISARSSAPGRCSGCCGAIPGAEVIDLDAGCCGMAGSFGYEMEHYEVSRLVGEQRLFPAVRQADARGRHRRAGLLLPAADPAFHRPRGGSSGRPASLNRFCVCGAIRKSWLLRGESCRLERSPSATSTVVREPWKPCSRRSSPGPTT